MRLSRWRLSWTAHHLDVQFANLLAQRVTVDAEQRRGAQLIAARLGEHPRDQRPFHLAQDPTVQPPTAAQLAPILGPTHLKGGQRAGPTGPLGPRLAAGPPASLPSIADLGFTGRHWRTHWRAAYGTTVLTKADYAALPDPTERTRLKRWLCGLRQDVETVFSLLTDRFGVKFPRARSRVRSR